MLSKLYKFVIPIRAWQLFIVCILCFGLGVQGVRANNLQMADLREVVFEADKTGGNVVDPLNDLSNFVRNHMGTSTEVQLKYTYERTAQKVAENAAETDVGPNLFANLPADCQKERGFFRLTSPCVREHLDRQLAIHGGDSQAQLPELPNKELFIYRFAAPAVSLDLAGISLLTSASTGIIASFLVIFRFARSELAFHRGDIEGL